MAGRRRRAEDPDGLRTHPRASDRTETVRQGVHVILEEEWEHHRYAVRDLARLAHPWGGKAGGADAGRWHVPDDVTAADLVERLHAGGERTTQILTTVPWSTRGAVGGRFTAEPTPTLAWIAFHVLQEYARHVGHLDVARELADGTTGE